MRHSIVTGVVIGMLALGAGLAPAQTPAIGANFKGSERGTHSGFVPPDTNGVIGPSHFVELINGRYTVYTRTGVVAQTLNLDGFFAAAGAGPTNYAFDPRVAYDPFSQRWFAVALDNPGAPNNFLFAVSKTSDPTQGWNGFKIDSDLGNQEWADFPQLGFNRDGVFVCANMFPVTVGFASNTLLVLPKADLLLATPTVANRTLFENVNPGGANGTGFSVQPAISMDDTPLPHPLLSHFNSVGNPAPAQIKRSSIGGSIGSPSYPGVGGLIEITGRPNPLNASQPAIGNPPKTPIHVGDSRFNSFVVLQNGELWGVQCVGGGSHAQVRWFRLDATTNAIIQEGFISDPANDLYYPSIAVNDLGTVVIGFTASGPTLPASSYCVVGRTISGTTTFGTPMLLKLGLDDYEALDGIGRNRWGDYSCTSVDPIDQSRFWTIQEWCPADDVWAMQITEVLPDGGGGNNVCSSATTIGNGTFTGTTVGASPDGAATCGNSNLAPDVWFRYIATTTGAVSIDTCGSSFDTVLSVHSACPGNVANQIACNDNATAGPCLGTFQSQVVINVTAGQTYRVRVAGANGAFGNFRISIRSLLVPNDNCEDATPIAGGPVIGTTLGATSDGSSTCTPVGTEAPDVWFSYTALCTGRIAINTCGSSFDTVLSVHAGCPGSVANELACNDDTTGGACASTPQSRVLVDVTAGQTYLIRVAGKGPGIVGSYILNLAPFAPANNACNNAIAIGNGTISFGTSGATTDGPNEPAGCNQNGYTHVDSDVWFRYTAACTGQATADLCASNFNTKVAIYGANCPSASGQTIACNDDACANRSKVIFPVIQGQQYLIRVGGFEGETGQGVLTMTCAGTVFCYPNCDGSSGPGSVPTLNVNDFICFQTKFALRDPYADCDNNGTYNVNDYICFQTRFAIGCQ